MPTVDLPGIRSMSTDSACIARLRSSASPVTLLYLTPASGLNSNVVTTGPGWICATWPSTANSRHFSSSCRAASMSSRSSIFRSAAADRAATLAEACRRPDVAGTGFAGGSGRRRRPLRRGLRPTTGIRAIGPGSGPRSREPAACDPGCVVRIRDPEPLFRRIPNPRIPDPVFECFAMTFRRSRSLRRRSIQSRAHPMPRADRSRDS